MWNAVWKVLQSQPYPSGMMVCTLPSPRVSASSPKSGEMSVVVTVWVCSHRPIHDKQKCSNTLNAYDWMWNTAWKVLQPQPYHSGMVCTLPSPRLSFSSPKSGEMSVVETIRYPLPLQLKELQHLTYACHGRGIQFERFYSLNHIIVEWFLHLHHLGFQPALPNLGKRLCW